MNMRVSQVTKMLLAVSKIVDAGNTCVFSKKRSYIKNDITGEETDMRRERGVFVMDIEVLGSAVTSTKEDPPLIATIDATGAVKNESSCRDFAQQARWP